jgi:4-hydroxythreonine-4-phosphate dehydrogenase
VTPRIAITTGEPAGIGPELLAKLSQQSFASTLIPIGDLTLLAAQGVAPRLLAQSVHVPLAVPAAAGSLAVANGPYVLETLARAHRGVVAGEWDAIVTLPIQKSVIIESGNPGFQGHTEYFASLANCEVVMMLVGGGLRVALATTHIRWHKSAAPCERRPWSSKCKSSIAPCGNTLRSQHRAFWWQV